MSRIIRFDQYIRESISGNAEIHNKEVADFIKKTGITHDQFTGKTKSSGRIFSIGLESVPEGFNPDIDGDLKLSKVKTLPDGFSPIVSKDLFLTSLQKIPKNFKPMVGKNLYLQDIEVLDEELPDSIGGDLYLNNLKKLEVGLTINVGEDLFLNKLKNIPEGFRPVVKGDLWLDKLEEVDKSASFEGIEGDIYIRNANFTRDPVEWEIVQIHE
jgi:hypothetical protein